MELQHVSGEGIRNLSRRPTKNGAYYVSPRLEWVTVRIGCLYMVNLGFSCCYFSLTYNLFSWYQILFYVKLLAVLVDGSFNPRYPGSLYFKFVSPQLRVYHHK